MERPPLTVGRYELAERLGRGGMAEVWRARIVGPAGFARELVVKRILPELAGEPEFVRMFLDEARLSARLHHPNIVQVFELGEEAGAYYLAMELVRGRTLVDLVRALGRRGVTPPGLAALVIGEVCRALGYAHALADEGGKPLKLVHRDVTPSNVMVTFEGQVKLLDFGIAKALAVVSDEGTRTGVLRGKLGYLSPEQVEGHEIDHRADLFSAGVLLHELLTGRRLFRGTGDWELIDQVRTAQVGPPSLLNPLVPPELDRICLRALARDPNQRFADGGAMAAELDALARAEAWGAERLAGAVRELFPVDAPAQLGAHEPTSATRVERPRPRRAPPWIGIGVGAAAIALGAGGFLWVRARRGPARIVVAAPAPVSRRVEVEPPPPAPPAPTPPPEQPPAAAIAPPPSGPRHGGARAHPTHRAHAKRPLEKAEAPPQKDVIGGEVVEPKF